MCFGQPPNLRRKQPFRNVGKPLIHPREKAGPASRSSVRVAEFETDGHLDGACHRRAAAAGRLEPPALHRPDRGLVQHAVAAALHQLDLPDRAALQHLQPQHRDALPSMDLRHTRISRRWRVSVAGLNPRTLSGVCNHWLGRLDARPDDLRWRRGRRLTDRQRRSLEVRPSWLRCRCDDESGGGRRRDFRCPRDGRPGRRAMLHETRRRRPALRWQWRWDFHLRWNDSRRDPQHRQRSLRAIKPTRRRDAPQRRRVQRHRSHPKTAHRHLTIGFLLSRSSRRVRAARPRSLKGGGLTIR